MKINLDALGRAAEDSERASAALQAEVEQLRMSASAARHEEIEQSVQLACANEQLGWLRKAIVAAVTRGALWPMRDGTPPEVTTALSVVVEWSRKSGGL